MLCKSSGKCIHRNRWFTALVFLLSASNRRSREAPSSPSSTCPSMLAACCPPSSPPSWEVCRSWSQSSNYVRDITCGSKKNNKKKLVCGLWFPAQECGIHKKMQCYPLAFGVPAALMVVALSKNSFLSLFLFLKLSFNGSTKSPKCPFNKCLNDPLYFLIISAVVFIVGSGMYNKTAPQGNIIVKVCRCIGVSGTQLIYSSQNTFQLEGGLTWKCCLAAVRSSPSRTAPDTVALSIQRESTGWTGLTRNMMWVRYKCTCKYKRHNQVM